MDKPDSPKERSGAVRQLSQTDLCAMMEERPKSVPISVNEPISQSSIRLETSNGNFLSTHLHTLSTFDPVFDFAGTGKLKPKEH